MNDQLQSVKDSPLFSAKQTDQLNVWSKLLELFNKYDLNVCIKTHTHMQIKNTFGLHTVDIHVFP